MVVGVRVMLGRVKVYLGEDLGGGIFLDWMEVYGK